jgi:hypothetical protein
MLLRIAARVEAASLLVLLLNLATVHVQWMATLVGPLHGCAYLVAIGATLQASRNPRIRWLSVVPGIGGLLADRGIRAAQRSQPLSGSR